MLGKNIRGGPDSCRQRCHRSLVRWVELVGLAGAALVARPNSVSMQLSRYLAPLPDPEARAD